MVKIKRLFQPHGQSGAITDPEYTVENDILSNRQMIRTFRS